MVCKNCEATFEGKFCSNCGQKAEIHRITLPHLFHELFHALTHADKGILLLAKALITRPGHVAREYIDGKRKKYFNPLSFLVLTAAVSAFVSYQTGYYKTMMQRPQSEQSAQAPQFKEPPSENMILFFKTLGEAGSIAVDYQKLLDLFLIFPLMSLLTWLFFRSKKANYAENLTINALVMGEYNVIMLVIFIPAFLIAPETAKTNNNILHGVMLVFMIVTYQQFFRNHLIVTILKTLVIMILYILLFWLLIMAFVLIKNSILGH